MSGYTQTILLDANRLSSEEYSASNLATTNPSVFTNTVSNGVTLDVGDQVSIESAHIAQRGAGGSVIQFSGKELGEKTITTTETTNSSFIGYHKSTTIQSYSPTGYAYETSSNEEQKVKVKDNGASVVISYYKNSNGENCISLPRNWGSPIASASSTNAGDPPSASDNKAFWNASDSYGKGLNTYYFNSSHIFGDDYISQQAMNCCGADCTVRKLKQDNSRYTIFKKAEIVWRQNAISSASNASYLQPVSTFPDPAIHAYNRLLQKVELNVDAGYNSPSTISSEITNQLLKSDNDEVIIGQSGPIVVESSIYKAIPAANYLSFSLGNNSEFFNAPATVDHMPIGVGTTSVNNAESTLYLGSYSHIGFKRPDFVEAGRAGFAYHGNLVRRQADLSGSGTAIIYTNFSYNDATLLNLKRFFDSQTLYPELFDYATVASNHITNYAAHNTTSASLNASFRNEARFLHIGISGSGNNASGGQALGSDMYNVSFSKNDFTNDRANASDNTSQPIFFYFNNNCSHLTAEDTIGDTDENLAYGFAQKWSLGGLDMVALITRRIGGIPTQYYGEQGGFIKEGTKIGYDFHFTGYGNAAIMLNTGYNELQYYGEINYFNGEDIRQTYLGANNALFNFDTTQSRFALSNLHSAEKVGNFYTAGDPLPSADVFAPPATAQAGQDCYKINKQLKFDSWSPSMHPYPVINLTGGTKVDGTQKTFIPLSPNLQSGIIYDSHSGVSIDDMGVPEQMWDKSIWGLLGFQYGQFNASGSNIKNINTRFNNDTINTSGVTTNANVTSQDGQQFHVNPYGTNMFNPMITSLVEIYDGKNIKNYEAATPTNIVNPAVTIVADSTQIVANELPRKILTGYFLINSDILDAANYYQLGNPLQTMAVVGKYNGANDFVEYGGGGPVFTITRKKTITSIKTQILNPGGETAQVGDNSGVIYKVNKQINTDLNFAENLLKGQYGKVKQ